MSEFASVRLRKNEDRRIRQGHLWIYSNEIDTSVTPLKGFEPGQPVVVEASNGKPLGIGTINPHSLIAVRLLSRNRDTQLGARWFKKRISHAQSLRERFFDKPYYRLVYGESDLLPGLVIDRHGDVFVIQITTAGMERLKPQLVTALEALYAPHALVFRNDLDSRKLEGLPLENEIQGTLDKPVWIEENGTWFELPVESGQKTGWFYDHRMGRRKLQALCKGQRVLDVFSYLGGWGVEAAVAGASEVVCVDSSAQALDYLERAAVRNGVIDRVATYQGNVFEVAPSSE